jgi:hypothetical protein
MSNMLERVPVGDVFYDDDTFGHAVVRCGDCAEMLLSSCVTDLALDGFAVARDGLDLDMDAYRHRTNKTENNEGDRT